MSETNPASANGQRGLPRRLVAGAVAVVVVLGLGYWWFNRGDAEGLDDLLTAQVGRGDIESSVTALGNLQPRDYVDVGAQVSGQLKKLHVAIGDTVKQGALVAEIDAVVLSAKVESTKAQLVAQRAQLIDREAQVVLAEDKYQRQVQLKADDATSEEAFQSAKQAFDSAKAQVSVLRAQIQQTESTLKGDTATLGYSQIFAPLAGTVVSITAREGQTLNANQVAPIVLRIADLSTMTVWTQVSEADIPKLRVGMDAYFTTLGNPDRRWTGKLRQVLPTPELNNNVVLYTALFDVENPDGELKTQMSAQVFFVIDSVSDVVSVPAAALHAWVPPAGEADKPATAPGEAPSPEAGGAPAGGPPGSAASGNRPSREEFAKMRREGRLPQGMGRGQGGNRNGGGKRPRVQAVTVINEDGEQQERRVVVGLTNRVVAQVLEGLEPGEMIVTGKRSAARTNQGNGGQPRGAVGGPPGGFGGGFRGF
ncbi:MAG: efflux RND transporter periplasmic adaptor subunit [Steroidobacteraceae bacterium]